MALNPRSLKNLEGVHPDLVAVVERAAEKQAFLCTEGLRSLERQQQLVRAKKSKTLNSRHLTGHAVDLCDTDGCYDLPDMNAIAKAMKTAAIELDIPLEWGGDWRSFVDTPHFQLPWKQYPAKGAPVVSRVVEAVKSKPAVLTTGTAAGGTAATSIDLPSPPDLAPVSAWQGFGETVSSLGSWAWQRPLLTLMLVSLIGVLTVMGRWRSE